GDPDPGAAVLRLDRGDRGRPGLTRPGVPDGQGGAHRLAADQRGELAARRHRLAVDRGDLVTGLQVAGRRRTARHVLHADVHRVPQLAQRGDGRGVLGVAEVLLIGLVDLLLALVRRVDRLAGDD